MAPYLLTIKELAGVLRKDTSTVHRMIREGRLPFEVIESMGVRQVRRVDVEEYVRCPIDLEVAS